MYRFLEHIPASVELESLGMRPRHCHFYFFVCYPGVSEDQPALGVTGHELFGIRRNASSIIYVQRYPKLDITGMFPLMLKFQGTMSYFYSPVKPTWGFQVLKILTLHLTCCWPGCL